MLLPSEIRDLQPVPDHWDPVFYAAERKPSAVAVVFLLEPHSKRPARLVLIRRSTRVGSHKGQIGFPGGRIEAGDANPAVTALRESQEEIGLDPNIVTVKGMLPPLVSIDGSLVFPVLAVAPMQSAVLHANPHEVTSIHLIPWAQVTDQNKQKFSFNLFGCWRDSFLYDCGEITIWGLSAEILSRAALKLEE